jgi:hypothetical protein
VRPLNYQAAKREKTDPFSPGNWLNHQGSLAEKAVCLSSFSAACWQNPTNHIEAAIAKPSNRYNKSLQLLAA